MSALILRAMRVIRLRSRPDLWPALLYLAVCVVATLVVVGMIFFAPTRSKFIAVWLVLLSLPWSDWVLPALGPNPLALWGGVLAGFGLNAAVLWGIGAAIVRVARWANAVRRRATSARARHPK